MTYDQSDFEQIAAAIGVDVGQIAMHRNQFEAAALWYELNRPRPTRVVPSNLSRPDRSTRVAESDLLRLHRPARVAPSNLLRKLDRVAKSARRLLKNLGVNDPDVAADGPGDRDILNALVLVGEPNEDLVVEATRRIGRLLEILEGVAAVVEFNRRAREAAIEVAEVGRLTVQQGNPGDDAFNDWTAAMMGLYRTIAGKEPATSVGAPERPNEGIAAGPLIRFLGAAGGPLELKFSEDAWRSRVRTVLKGASLQN